MGLFKFHCRKCSSQITWSSLGVSDLWKVNTCKRQHKPFTQLLSNISWKRGALNNDEDSFTTFTPRKMLSLLNLKHQFLGPARSSAGYLESLIKSRRGISVMQDHSGSINIYVHLLFVWSTAAIHYHPSRISL